MRARHWVCWAVAAAMLSGPIHCLGEALEKHALPASLLSISASQRGSLPVMDVKMCCHPTEGTARAMGVAPYSGRSMSTPLSLAALSILLGHDRLILPRSLGPPGRGDPVVRASNVVLPFLI